VNYLPAISLMIMKRAMTEALKVLSRFIRKEVHGFNPPSRLLKTFFLFNGL